MHVCLENQVVARLLFAWEGAHQGTEEYLHVYFSL